MDSFELAEFAKNSENKEDSTSFTEAVQEEGIAQGSLIVSRLYNTMLGSITRVMKSWDSELTNVLKAAGVNPSALTDEQLLAALKALIKTNSGGTQLGDLIPNIGTTSPAGRVLCNGQTLSNCKTVFPEFYNYVINNTPYKTAAEWEAQKSLYGQCGYCAVDGDDVIVPLITRPISGVTNLSQTGQAVSDTMRPITGTVSTSGKVMFANPSGTGAFKVDSTYWESWTSTSSAGETELRQLSFDSSRLGTNYSGSETRGKQVQYPYYIQVYTAANTQSVVDVAALVDLLKYQNQVGVTNLTVTGGNISLASGGIYTCSLAAPTAFILPETTDKTVFNQILLQLYNGVADLQINCGTKTYFNGVPSTAVGYYNMVWEYDVLQSSWVCGQIEKVAG